MQHRRRGTVLDLRRENRAVVLRSLYFSRPGSRQDLSSATGLSVASVTNVARELLDEGIVTEAGCEDSDGGRPRVLLDINPDYGYVIGVDIGETRIRVDLFDLTMTERAKAEYPLNPAEHEVDEVVRDIASGLAEVLADGGIDPRRSSASESGFRGSSSRVPRSSCTARLTDGTRCRWSGCCESIQPCRCGLRTAPRRWARPSCGPARGAGRGTLPWCLSDPE